MTKEEANKIVLKLTALFPNTSVPKETVVLWVEYLLPLQADIMRQAVNDYALTPGKKFFPTPGELLDIYDRIYQEFIVKKAQDDREAEKEAAKFLFQKPTKIIKDDYVRQSVELIRNVCEDRIKYNSPEWIERFEGIYGKGAMYHV